MGLMLASLPDDLPLARKLDRDNDSPLRSFFPGGGVLIARNVPRRGAGLCRGAQGRQQRRAAQP